MQRVNSEVGENDRLESLRMSRRSIWLGLAALVAGATTARAEPVERATATVELSAAGETALVRWTGVPNEAVEQEVLLSLDGGRTWLEVARPTSIADREIEIPLPQGVAADLRFAVRAGDEASELGEWETSTLRVTPARDGTASLGVAAGWRAGDSRTDPGHGRSDPLRAAESRFEEEVARPEREAAAPRGVTKPAASGGAAGHLISRSGPFRNLDGSPPSIPLRN
jgi:hypothetical protein